MEGAVVEVGAVVGEWGEAAERATVGGFDFGDGGAVIGERLGGSGGGDGGTKFEHSYAIEGLGHGLSNGGMPGVGGA